jgi:hypothetical protein
VVLVLEPLHALPQLLHAALHTGVVRLRLGSCCRCRRSKARSAYPWVAVVVESDVVESE